MEKKKRMMMMINIWKVMRQAREVVVMLYLYVATLSFLKKYNYLGLLGVKYSIIGSSKEDNDMSTLMRTSDDDEDEDDDDDEEGLKLWESWRMGVEANNVQGWRTVPPQCSPYIKKYYYNIGQGQTTSQYLRDLQLITHHILDYAKAISTAGGGGGAGDGMDAWILDVDDTCISNLPYYHTHQNYGCDPFDPVAFKAWIFQGRCPVLHPVLPLFKDLLRLGFKVFLVTGRDHDTMAQVTLRNLHNEGFLGYHRLILRPQALKGESAVKYKSGVRKKITEQGYRIWGNVGDQWTDLLGDYPAFRNFKLPNPMYFIP